MASHPEALLISAMIRTGDYQTPIHRGINSTHFHIYKNEWKWLERFIARYRKTPSKTAFKHKFPDFPLKKVDDVDHFAEEVKREYGRFMFNNLLDEGLDYIEKDDIEKAIKHVHSGLTTIQSSIDGDSGEFNLLSDHSLVYQEAKRRVQLSLTKGIPGVPSGFPTLDGLTGGAQPGDYWVVAARLGQGKTWTLNSMVINAIKDGHDVAYFALEQTKTQIAFRILSLLSSSYGKRVFPASALRRGQGFKLEEFRKFLEALPEHGLGQTHIFDSSRGRVTTLTIAAQIEKFRPAIVFIDYLTLMDTKDKDWQSIAKMSNDIQQLAQRYETPIVVAAQINRMGEGKEPPKAHHLSGSDAIGQDADVVITLAQQSKHVVKYRLVKFRDGEDQSIWYSEFNPDRGRYGEISGNRAEEIIELDNEEE